MKPNSKHPSISLQLWCIAKYAQYTYLKLHLACLLLMHYEMQTQSQSWIINQFRSIYDIFQPSNRASFLFSTEQPSNHHGSTLPPVPPPHRQHPSITALNQSLGSTHHAGQSLNSTRQLTPPTGSPAPVAGQSLAELQTTPPESVPLQDSWVLGSNVPLETR